MALPSVFDKDVTEGLISRVNQLTNESVPNWGKMTIDQMLAHVNVAYEMAFTDKHPKAGTVMRWILKSFVKKAVVNDQPYKRNSRTAPAFLMKGPKNYENEKSRLMEYLKETQNLGAEHFDQKESPSFGPMTSLEWSNLFYKHLDHHLTQFGV